MTWPSSSKQNTLHNQLHLPKHTSKGWHKLKTNFTRMHIYNMTLLYLYFNIKWEWLR